MRFIEFTESDIKGQAEEGVIRDVLILGSASRNKRTYSPSALRQAARLYEGAAVYMDHPTQQDKERKGRSANDRFGVLQNVRFVESAVQLRGDLLHLTTHPLAPRIEEDRKRDLHFFGLSHVADGHGRFDKGTGMTVVEQIEKVLEVDLVTNPATAVSLTEQAETEAGAGLEGDVVAILRKPDLSIEEKENQIVEIFKSHAVAPIAEQVVEPVVVEPVTEQVVEPVVAPSTDEIRNLTEQVTALKTEVDTLKVELAKPRKYLPPRTAPVGGGPVRVTEQVADSYPENGTKEEKARWLKARQ